MRQRENAISRSSLGVRCSFSTTPRPRRSGFTLASQCAGCAIIDSSSTVPLMDSSLVRRAAPRSGFGRGLCVHARGKLYSDTVVPESRPIFGIGGDSRQFTDSSSGSELRLPEETGIFRKKTLDKCLIVNYNDSIPQRKDVSTVFQSMKKAAPEKQQKGCDTVL